MSGRCIHGIVADHLNTETVIGALGASGGTVEQDQKVANAAVAAFHDKRTATGTVAA